MRKDFCCFCSRGIFPGHGITLISNDGQKLPFCRSKCTKNFETRRRRINQNWIATKHIIGKRNLQKPLHVKKIKVSWKRTLDIMKKMDRIMSCRMARYYAQRIKQTHLKYQSKRMKNSNTQLHLK